MKFKVILLFAVMMGALLPINAVNVGSIAEYCKLADETEVTFTCKLTVLAHKGRKLFVTDGKNGALIYGVLTKTYEFGDVFGEGVRAVKTTCDMSPEMVRPVERSMRKIGSNTDIKPGKMTVGNVSMDNVYQYASLSAFYNPQTKTLKSGNKKILLLNIFGVEMPMGEGQETFNGILVYHMRKDVMQLYVM